LAVTAARSDSAARGRFGGWDDRHVARPFAGQDALINIMSQNNVAVTGAFSLR
jgi:hypothetical protein